MGRYSNIRHTLHQKLLENDHRGESKFDAKLAERAAAAAEGRPYEQVVGIYSTETLKTYDRGIADFSRYIVDHYKHCKSADDARQYVDAYHAHLQASGVSAWTVRTRMAAVLRAYGLRSRDLAMRLPVRKSDDIVRSSRAREYSYKTQPRIAYAERVRNFLRATGCRRAELIRLRPKDFRMDENGNYEVYRRGKGGKQDWYPTVKGRQDDIRDMLEYKEMNPASMTVDPHNGEVRLFSRSEYDRLHVHACRAEYAQELYAQYLKDGCGTGKMYYCRGARKGEAYDRGALKQVSEALGHHRIDVVVAHYLRRD